MPAANAIAEYIDADTGECLAVDRYYDPGLDPASDYWRIKIKAGQQFRPHMAYSCGRPLSPLANARGGVH